MLSALHAFNLRDKIAGVACLATPFISARERDLGQDSSEIMGATGSTLAVMVLLVFNELFPSWSMLDPYTFLGAIFPLCILLVYVLGSVRPSALEFLAKDPRRYAKRLRDELTSLPPKRSQFLIIRSPADEASGALAMFQFISQITVRVCILAQRGRARLGALASSLEKRTRTLSYCQVWCPAV